MISVHAKCDHMDLLLVVATFFALIGHGVLRRFWFAIALSVALSTLTFAWLAGGHIGGNLLEPETWDVYFMKNISITIIVSVAVSFVIGSFFVKVRRRKA